MSLQHARLRAKQRFGLRFKQGDTLEISRAIAQKKAKLIEDQVLRGIYELEFKGKTVRVVFDNIKKKVVTFVPMPGTKDFKAHYDRKKGGFYALNQPTYIPLDTDFNPWANRLP